MTSDKKTNFENWKMNRAGFVNFWYYDNEIFDFQDGRLLLRGSNGSGKSVTMQSLIPLLLDGNKSPDRLDPFGSKARKIDNYLLDENGTVDDRTGYIFMEFIKSNSQSYLTIGLGIRARRNMPVSSWGFCIIDGKRIGKDIELTKTTIGDIPLTKKELQNRLGDGGFVFDSMNDYKNKVNSLLFGYDNIDDYSDLIKLLIQLRSPKLSKDFKPTVLYEIMTNALQTLSDDDLRPMSEAIESMDIIKCKLEGLNTAEKACNRIYDVYDKYNRLMIYDKSLKFIEAQKNLRLRENEIAENETKKKNAELEIEKGQKMLEDAEINEKVYKEENESLKQRDEYKLEQKLSELNKKLEENQIKLSAKNNQLDKKKSKLAETEKQLKDFNSECELSKQKLYSIIDELSELANELCFDEFEFIKDDFISNINESYDLSNLSKRFIEYKEKIKKAIDLLKKKKEVLEVFEQREKQCDDCEKIKEKNERIVKECEQLFTDIKDEYITAVNSYSNNNSILIIPKEKLEKLSEKIYSYTQDSYFEDIYSIFIDCYNNYKSDLSVKLSIKEEELKQKNQEIIEKQQEVKKWENTKEPEPERKEEVINNRKKLDDMGIPYVPFYKLLDFNEGINDSYKGIIEESLVDMGLLDALIVPEKYREQVLSISDKNICDRYIFSDPKYLSYELSSALHIDKNADKAFIGMDNKQLNEIKSGIDDAIKSILVDNTDNSTFISETGIYGIGIIKGKITGNYKAKYIGTAARKQLREDKIKELNDCIESLNKDKAGIVEKLEQIKKEINILESEKDSFPKKDDLETAKKALQDSIRSLNYSSEQYDKAYKELKDAAEQLAKIKEETYYACEKIYIEPKTYDKYSEALELCGEYENAANNLSSEHRVFLKIYEFIQAKQNEKEDLYEEIDNISVEIRDFERDINELQETISSINEQLKLADYESVKKRIQECINMLDNVIPKQKKDAYDKMSSNKNKIENCDETLDRLNKEKEVEQFKFKSCSDAFIKEFNLKLISEFEYDGDYEKAATNIVDEIKNEKIKSTNITDISQRLNTVYFTERNSLTEYTLNLENVDGRMLISARQSGKNISFIELRKLISDNIEIQKQLIKDKDREIFEEILFNNLNKIIRAKINMSKTWVKSMNNLMESLDTSSGLSFSLRWKGKKGESEDEISTEELVELLDKDQKVLRESDKEKFAAHFRSKIEKARNMSADQKESKSFHAIIKELLDYRQWFEFQLYYTKTNEKKRELTNNAFYQFSGGEKAMAMYVPLFSAVSARYSAAASDSPRIISLDEAFAGVDSKNIRDMFKLLRELKLDFIVNSQVLWGDYDTVPSLGISEILRPNNSDVITVIKYIWNGKSREMVV